MADTANRKRLLENELDRILNILKKRNPDTILLFGSLAEGGIESFSDIDLIIVESTEKPFFSRIEEIRRLIHPRVAIDIFIYTPEEFGSMVGTNSFIREAVARGKILYEKQKN